MLDVDSIVSTICGTTTKGQAFEPSDIYLTDYFISSTDGDAEEELSVRISERDQWAKTHPIAPHFPHDVNVTAIDSTSTVLGQLPDGLVGAVRASLIIKLPGRTDHRMERYGPYVVDITTQNKDAKYRKACAAVFGKQTSTVAPDCAKTLDRIRNLLERHLQLEAVKKYTDSLILLDGSLIGGTVSDPLFIVRKLMSDAFSHGNSIAAISKSTALTLHDSQKNILSLLDGVDGPCHIGSIKEHIIQKTERYLGHVYVARFTPLGESFRVDIPEQTVTPHTEILAQVAGLSGDYGYPEELKLAHMTCVLSSIEVLELQAAAVNLYGLTMKEELRRRLFPM